MSYGLRVAKDGEKIRAGNVSYDSGAPRLQVALNKDPKHTGVESVKGTGLQVFAAGVHEATETLFRIPHGLRYRPKVLVYFNRAQLNSYAVGTFYYGFGAIDDYLTYEVTDTAVLIKHVLTDNLASSNYTSLAPSFGKIQVKYLIFSNPIDKVTAVNRTV